jgi:hypothetical protein
MVTLSGRVGYVNPVGYPKLESAATMRRFAGETEFVHATEPSVSRLAVVVHRGKCSVAQLAAELIIKGKRGPDGGHDQAVVLVAELEQGAFELGGRQHPQTSAKRLGERHLSRAAWPSRCSSPRTSSRGKGSSLGSLASACAVSQHPAVAGIQA